MKKFTTQANSTLLLAGFLMALSACGTSHPKADSSEDFGHAKETTVQIDYFLGHNQHRFLAQAGHGVLSSAAPSSSSILNPSSQPVLNSEVHHAETAEKSSSAGTFHAEVTTYLERDLVQQAAVDPQKYETFLSKAFDFTQKPRRTLSQDVECRSPFAITVKIDEKTYTSKGCRSSDEGTLSRLVRDGELLLYSKK